MSTTTRRDRIAEEGWELGIDAWTSPTPAVRGRLPGREGWTGAYNGESLTKFLGWFSVGLGTLEILAPRQVSRMIGLRPSSTKSSIIRAMGLREIANGVGILNHPRSKEWVATRVGGDMLDLALLGAALARSDRPGRTLFAAAAVLGVAALDVRETEELAQSRKAPSPDAMDPPSTHIHKSITVERPRAEVYSFWRELTNLPRFMDHLESVEILGDGRSHWRAAGPAGSHAEWDAEIVDNRENERISWRSVGSTKLYNTGTVHFRDGTGGRGTVVTVEMHYAPPGGMIGAAMLKLFRKEPGQQVGDDLRRFKQVMETGEVVLSDASAASGAHAAQPSRRSTP